MENQPGTAASAEFDKLWSTYWLELQQAGPLTFTRYRLLLALLPADLPPAPRILDVGCGPGTFLLALSQRLPDAQVQGVEVSASACNAAPERIRGHLLTGDLLDVAHQFGALRFDLLVCSEVLEHVPDPERFLRQIVGLAAPGARLLFTVPAGMRHWSLQDDMAGHRRRFEPLEFDRLLREAGLVVETQYTWGGPVSWFYNHAINLIGPRQAAGAVHSRAGRLAARLLCAALRIDDLFLGKDRFQLISRARKPAAAA